MRLPEHVIDGHTARVLDDQEDQVHDCDERNRDGEIKPCPVCVANPAPEAGLLPRSGTLRLRHRAEPKRSSALDAISRSPLYARSVGASSSGSHRAAATSCACSGGMSPSRPRTDRKRKKLTTLNTLSPAHV